MKASKRITYSIGNGMFPLGIGVVAIKKKLGSVLGNFFVIIFISVNLYSFLNIFYYYLF